MCYALCVMPCKGLCRVLQHNKFYNGWELFYIYSIIPIFNFIRKKKKKRITTKLRFYNGWRFLRLLSARVFRRGMCALRINYWQRSMNNSDSKAWRWWKETNEKDKGWNAWKIWYKGAPVKKKMKKRCDCLLIFLDGCLNSRRRNQTSSSGNRYFLRILRLNH